MRDLLLEFLDKILNEAQVRAVKKGTAGSPDRVVVFGSEKTAQAAIKAGTHRAFNARKDKHLVEPEKKTAGDQKPKKTVVNKTVTPADPSKDGITATIDATNLNINSLASLVKQGTVVDPSGKKASRPPGNDFSRYSEAASSFIAQYVSANPEASTEDLVSRIVQLDCDSKLLTSEVTVQLPKKSPFYKEFEELEASGVFNDGCGTEYSRGQNMARFMTAIVARTKGNRMHEAVKNLQNTGDLSGAVTVDAFSGDQKSLARMQTILSSLPQGAKIYTESGEELSKEETTEFLQGFGTARFPADTALIATDSKGNLVVIGYSDKKELNAIINNTTVAGEFTKSTTVIDALVAGGRISKKDAEKAKQQIEQSKANYEKIESELADVTASPARAITKLIKSGNNREINKLISELKTASGGSDPQKYWNRRIGVFQKQAEKPATEANEREYLQWLRKAGWNGKSTPTDKQSLAAWALKCEAVLKSEDSNLPQDDQTLLVRSGLVDQAEIYSAVGKIRDRALATLTTHREQLNEIKIEGIPLGTFMDAQTAWRALHLDMGDYKGALTVVAEDVVVDFQSVEECLQGIKSARELASNLQIRSERITSREYTDAKGNQISTGQRVEVFSVTPKGDRIDVGIKTLRSKQGVLGKLNVTWNYHPEFQNCLKQHMRAK